MIMLKIKKYNDYDRRLLYKLFYDGLTSSISKYGTNNQSCNFSKNGIKGKTNCRGCTLSKVCGDINRVLEYLYETI